MKTTLEAKLVKKRSAITCLAINHLHDKSNVYPNLYIFLSEQPFFTLAKKLYTYTSLCHSSLHISTLVNPSLYNLHHFVEKYLYQVGPLSKATFKKGNESKNDHFVYMVAQYRQTGQFFSYFLILL